MRLPDDSQRLNLYGRTGSGKTVAGLWHLEKRHFLQRPWLIVDTKGDSTLADIPRLEEVGFKDAAPKHGGLYIIRPLPHEIAETGDYLWKLWQKGNAGVFFDEAADMGQSNRAFNALCKQGRSIRVPLICCSQRPVRLGWYCMSEADYHQVFRLINPRDKVTITEWIPGMGDNLRAYRNPPKYHSYYYDVEEDNLELLSPVPNKDEILNRLDLKMPGRRRGFFRPSKPLTLRPGMA